MVNLSDELNHLHSLIFGFLPDSGLQSQYNEAHQVYQKHIDEGQQSRLNAWIRNREDLISLEFFWRLKNKKNILSQKFLIIFYLTEVKKDYQDVYIGEKNDRLAFWKLAYYTSLSCFRLVKGAFLYKKLRVLK